MGINLLMSQIMNWNELVLIIFCFRMNWTVIENEEDCDYYDCE